MSGQCWWVQPCVVSTGFGAESYWGMQDWLLRPSSRYLFVPGVTGPPAQGHKTLRSHRGEAVPKCPQQDIPALLPTVFPRQQGGGRWLMPRVSWPHWWSPLHPHAPGVLLGPCSASPWCSWLVFLLGSLFYFQRELGIGRGQKLAYSPLVSWVFNSQC